MTGIRFVHCRRIGALPWGRDRSGRVFQAVGECAGEVSARQGGDIVGAGESLGARLVQHGVYGMSLVLYRAQFVELDSRTLKAHRKAQQR